MVQKLVHYIVKKEELNAVKEAIGLFLEKIKEKEPNTKYEAFGIKDSTTFYHIMTFSDEESEKKHSDAVYTKEFASILYPRCIVEPKFMDIESL